MAKKTKVLKGDAYITNVKATTGVVSLADKVQDITSGKILGFDVFHTSGEQANKVSWFKIKGWCIAFGNWCKRVPYCLIGKERDPLQKLQIL